MLKYRPIDKLKDEFINILAGGHGIVEINRLVRTDAGLQRAFGRKACGEQSTISRTLSACSDKNVEEMTEALKVIYRKQSQGYRHDYEKSIQVLDIDITGLVAGRQAEGATKGYFSGKRNRRGRQLGRVLATNYGEIVRDKLYQGTVQLDQNLQELVKEAEGVLDLDESRRKRTLIRIEGGGGKDEDINWLLERGYWVMGKVKQWRRARKLANTVTTWYPDSKEPGREYGWVNTPHEYTRATRQIAIRSEIGGKTVHRVLVFNLTDEMLSDLAQATASSTTTEKATIEAALYVYDQRGGGVETSNKGSKQGLGLNKRIKRSFAAQEILTLLAQLAFNLIVWVRSLLAKHNPALAQFGTLRMVRDLFHIQGSFRLDHTGKIFSVCLNSTHDLALSVWQTWHASFALDGLSLILRKI